MRSHRANSQGFVLVGVVMLVLALTILGFSLFSLSGFEAQFFGGAMHETQAFYDATGGIDRAKFVLENTGNLASVKQDLPLEGVVWASARYVESGDSTRDVDWDDATKLIQIRVVAEERGLRKVLEANFTPGSQHSVYENTLVTNGNIAFLSDHDSWQIHPQGSFHHDSGEPYGRVQLNPNTYVAWDSVGTSVPPIIIKEPVPGPDVDAFINAHIAEAEEADWVEALQTYYLHKSIAGAPKFYRVPSGMGEYGYALHDENSSPHISVSGRAVWLIEGGASFRKEVTVDNEGDPEACLIIIATAGGETISPSLPNVALRFKQALYSRTSPMLPVILVSNGTIALELPDIQNFTPWIDYISVFASGIYFRTSSAQNCKMDLFHPPTADAQILNKLYDLGLLPNTVPGQGRKLILKPGTWREVTESDPS